MNANDNHPGDLGVIYKKSSGQYTVHANDQIISCTLSPHLSMNGNGKKSLTQGKHCKSKPDQISEGVTIGDRVRFIPRWNGSGIIIELLPRENKLSRRSAVPMPGAHAFEQVIVANVDLVVPVFAAANPEPRWHLLDRYLVTAEANHLPALICITKLDLIETETGRIDAGFLQTVEIYRKIGYPVVMVSAQTGEGLTEIEQALRGKTAVFLGKSGVGKSSLLNALQPGLGLRTKEVNLTTGKGKHTTTHLEMFPLENGGRIVDTPGIREFGLWDIDDAELALFFREMRPFIGHCRFGLDCQHDEEPGCAVRKAVMSGQINPLRYQSYMHMKQGD